jgi:hypothetical protein
MPGMTNAELIRKATGAIGTGDFLSASGLLPPEQASKFLDAAYTATEFTALHRKEKRKAKAGNISKIGIGRRLLRKKTAGVDDATLVKPSFGDVGYQTVYSRLDWEIEEEVFEENIEGEGLEEHLTGLMTGAVGRDLEDLHFNGDVADVSVDAPFLTQNEGWLKLIAAGGSGAHRVNAGTIDAGAVTKGQFFAAINAMPNKYSTDQLRFILSPTTLSRYVEYLSNRATAAGDAVLVNGDITTIAGVKVQKVSAMPNTRIVLADPKNFIADTTRDIRRRKTTEGREAIRTDKRFYAFFLDDDPIVQEMDAVVDVYGLPA